MATKWRWKAIYEMKHKSVGIQQNAIESVGWATCIWKDTGGFVVGRRNFWGCRIREQSALDNPRADVYNKDKERRCPHNGQLPSLSVTLENMTAEVWDATGGHFSCHYFFESCFARCESRKIAWASVQVILAVPMMTVTKRVSRARTLFQISITEYLLE